MISAARTIAAASLSILSGTAAAQENILSVVELLNLSLDRTSTYFNNATNMAVSERCTQVDAQTVACDLRVMANKAQLDFTYQAQLYQLNGRSLTVSSGTLDQGSWSSDVYYSQFKPAALKNSHMVLTASSPLVDVAADGVLVQNDARKVSMSDDYRVTACSVLPVSQNRAIELCSSFADKAPVRADATMKVLWNGAVVSSKGKSAGRDFQESDWDIAVSYGAEVAKGYGVSRPYTPN